MEKTSVNPCDLIAYTGLKRVEVFRTNVEKEQDADQLLMLLSHSFPRFDVNFDLEDCDHILRVEGHAVANEQIIDLMLDYGYECSALV